MDQLKTSPACVDDHFIHAIQTGGAVADKAIMTVYATHHKEIRALIATLISRYGRIKADPADLVHDSFIVMLHKIRYESPEINSLRAYWLGIAKYMWLNVNRSARINIVAEPDADYNMQGISPEQLMLEEERLNEIERCLCKCGGRCHEILTLWLSDYSMGEIADKLNLSSAAMARKIKHECFKKLKNILINSNVLIH